MKSFVCLAVLLVTLLFLFGASSVDAKFVKKYVYAGVQSSSGNQIYTFVRKQPGLLKLVSKTATGGNSLASSPVDPVGSQNSMIFSSDSLKSFILFVNSGSNSISILKRNSDGTLTLKSTIGTNPGVNASKPISLAADANTVYVLNNAALASIQGYTADWSTGTLTMIAGTNMAFSGTYGQIGINNNQLIIAGKGANNIFRVFTLDSNFVPTTSTGLMTVVTPGPFSFIWDPTLKFLLSTASTGAASYTVDSSGAFTQVSVINTTSAASCWIDGFKNSNNFYVVNAGQPSISGFTLGSSGQLTQIKGNLYTGATNITEDVALFGAGSVPLDLAISSDGHYLHVLLGGRGNVATFAINSDGTLISRGEVAINQPGYNAGLNGILAE